MNGDVIKKELKRAGISQKQLAKKIFVTPQAVSKWINNKSQPTFDNIKMMSKVFKVDLAKKMVESETGKIRLMNKSVELENLNTLEKAEIEAKSILEKVEIEEHYSHSIYLLLKWLITATIGLTYYHLKNPMECDPDSNFSYNDIYFFLHNFYEEIDEFDDRFENGLEYDFYSMIDHYRKSPKSFNEDYFYGIFDLWNCFIKLYDKNKEAEFKIALAEILASNSQYSINHF